MKSNGWASPSSKQVLFLAHSLGGFLLKQAMVMLANSGDVEIFMLGNIRGAVFFGVPSRGMEVSQLLAMTKGQPNEALVKDLSPGSSYVSSLGLQFDGISALRKMKFFWAYETKQSPTVVKTNGQFSRSGPPMVLVSKDSATNGLCDSKPLSTFQIDDDHSGMVKFSQGDSRAGVVTQILRDITDFEDIYSPRVLHRADTETAASPNSMAVVDGMTRVANGVVSPDTRALAQSVVQNMFSTSFTLRSLRAPERDLRLEQIDPVHTHTFGWVYEKRSVNFADWLRKGRGIFWISGKPGSGKSTMMKLIHNDRRTSQLTQSTWGSRSRKVAATFFFHHRGTTLQKSFEGLLRGIISQVVEKEPELALIPQAMLVEEYFDRAQREKLGDLPSDILDFFNWYELRYDGRADQDVRELMRSMDSRAQLQDVFSTALRGMGRLEREHLEETLLSEQSQLQRSEVVGNLDDAVQSLCSTTLHIRYSEDLRNRVRQWLLRIPDLKTAITELLQRRGVEITKEVERNVLGCTNKQERREAIFSDIQRTFWTRQALETALSRIICQNLFDLELTLFLDALDEYDGRPEFIAEFLTSIIETNSPRTCIRVCFSSRPWTVFIEEFGECPGFKIHEHTEDDIQAYCVDIMSATLGAGPALTDLVPEIVRRAQGVFLWVRLVVEDLTSAARRLGANVSYEVRGKELRDVLDSLPRELSDYYIAIIHRIPQTLRWDTYVLLECVSRAQDRLGLNIAFTALRCSRASKFKIPRKLESGPIYPPNEFIDEVRMLSGGLVEVIVTEDNTTQRADPRVDRKSLQFMHQTVQEFVQDPEFKHKVLDNAASITFENGNSFLFKAYFLGLPSRCGFPDSHTEIAAQYAREAEITTGRSQYTIISDAPRIHFPVGRHFPHHADSKAYDEAEQSTISPLKFAVFYGLDLYIRDIPNSTPNRLKLGSPFRILVAMLQQERRTEYSVVQTAQALVDRGFSPTEADILLLSEHPCESCPTSRSVFRWEHSSH